MSFNHLHTHSEYSVLDGIIKPKQLIARAKEFGQNAIALTDKGNLYGVFEFWKECHEQEMKPILGAELFVTKNRADKNAAEKTSNLVVLARNFEGYKNLIKLVSLGHLEGFYYKPRVDKEILSKYKEGIIVLSGGRYSELTQNIELGNIERAKEIAATYKGIFGENYYIELVRTGDSHDEDYVQKLIKIAKELDISVVATADVFYLVPEDYEAREMVWAINDGKKLVDPSRRQDHLHALYMKSPEEMEELWKDLPDAIENTQKIADQIEDYKIGFGKVEPKSLDVPQGRNSSIWLRQLAFEGAIDKYGIEKHGKIPTNVEERLNYELGIINDKGYNDYFLVVMEYVNWANDQNIPTSCRGSGASSCVAYCIGITPLEPLRWKLPFERFLNPERNSFPDFDIDMADSERYRVFEHMREKYGEDNTCNIGAIGRMKSKAVIRDVGRVMGVPLSVCDKLSKLVTVKFGKPASLKEMMDPEKHAEFAQIVSESDDLKKLIQVASKIENNMRQVSTHACGFLCTPDAVINYIPLQRETKGERRVITEIEGAKMEDLGLMKFDFLGLSNLSTIAFAVDIIEKNHGFRLNIKEIPEDDAKTFALLQKADTAGVFQLESSGMQKYIKDLKPTTVEDISFMCAAYRPGPMQFIPPYINRKHGREQVTYPHEVLKPVLEETYGYAIYQEQVMEIARVFSGYTLGAADMLRRAMGKKKAEVMAAEKTKFIEGAVNNGHTEKEAEKIFSYLEPFADYGFNKAHSAAYAMIAYQTAYLKANYTIEFIAALMQTDLDDAEKLTRDIIEAQKHGIQVLPPDVNKSIEGFNIEEQSNKDGIGGKIRFGLGGLKSVGLNQVEEIVTARGDKEFASLEDFLSRIDHKKLSKSAVEVLIKVGAMQDFGNRAQLLEVFQNAYENSAKMAKNALNNGMMMFDEEEVKRMDPIRLPNIPEINSAQRVEWEKEYLGIYFSIHPLAQIMPELSKKDVKTLMQLKKDARVGNKLKIAASIKKLRCVSTKKDNKKMCFGTIEDADSEINFTVFPTVYEKFGEILQEGKTYIIYGKKDYREEQHGILVDTIELIDFTKYKIDQIVPEAEESFTDDIIKKEFAKSDMTEIKSPKAEEQKVTVPLKANNYAYNYTVPQTVVPVESNTKSYKGVKIHIPTDIEVDLLKRLNEYFLSKPGDGEIVLVLKDTELGDKTMVLNTKLAISDAVEEDIKSIVDKAGLSFF